MRLKHVRIALDQSLLHFLAFFQMLLRVTLRTSPHGIIFTVDTVTAVAEHVGREALTVQLQTPRLPTITRVLLPSKRRNRETE